MTRVPVSIGIAVEVKAKVAALFIELARFARATIVSTAIMASSTRRPRAMMRAPSEMRCSEIFEYHIPRKVDREDERDRQGDHQSRPEAEADEADDEHDHDGLEQRLGEPPTASSTTAG